MAAAEQSSEPVRDYGSPATWGDVADLKADIVRLESKLDLQIAEVRADIATMESRLEARFAQMQAAIAQGNERMIRWTLTAVAAGVAVIAALVGVLEAV